MEPPEKVVDKNQPGFGESVNIPPEIFTRLVATSGEDEGGTKDELDQIQKKQITPDLVQHHLASLPPTPKRVTARWKKTRRNLFNHSSGAASTKHTPKRVTARSRRRQHHRSHRHRRTAQVS
jgi:hypothetical protein